MKKRNVISYTAIASALLVLAGSVNAGTLSTTNTVFATENFTAANTTPVALSTVGPISYSTASSLTANPSTHLFFTLRLTNGTFAATPAVTDFKLAGTTAAASVGPAVPGLVITLSTDKTTVLLDFTTQTGATTLLGLSAMTWTPSAGNVLADNATMAVAGGTINAAAVLTLVTIPAANLESTVALATSADGATATGAIASSNKAITSTIDALPLYTGKIDLTAVPVASAYTVADVALGAVTFKDVATVQGQSGNSTFDYTVVAGSANTPPTNVKIDVTPGTGQAFPVGATLFADVTSTACAVPVAGTTTAAFTTASSLLKTTITFPTASLVSGTAINICMSKPGVGKTASPITATITGTITEAVGTDAKPTVTGIGYPLDFNGSTRTVRSYIPASTVGYTSFVRAINTGTVDADVTGQFINEDGTLSASGKLFNLKAGGSLTVTSAAVEAAIGVAPAATARPRLRLTAPTNTMDAQSFFLTNANGNFSDVTGAQ
ncbi:MAG: hypothetical protein CO065_02065 [Comamonadaceae bacterium CG_4_9_14_0_8_um_filter_57_21]|nr:MAG: hypothetical protein CO065_02065 [Comamonadaceae bacterium CG_4_9_14_0_8_um_filter_57_21]